MNYKNLLASMFVFLCLLCIHRTGFAQEKNKASDLPDIVYTSEQDNFEDGSGIYLLSNGKSKLLTPGFLDASKASWSPDGAKIVFDGKRKKSDPSMIFILDIDQNKFTQLTNKKRDSYNPSWSPDGKTIAFDYRRFGEELKPDLFLMNSDGSNIRRLTSKISCSTCPSWSPDGTQIAFVHSPNEKHQNANINILSATIDGTKIKRMTTGKGWNLLPSWSPDGKRIAFASHRHADPDNVVNFQIFVMNSDGTNVRKITNSKHNSNAPDWSPDGKRILFYSITHKNTKELLRDPAELFVINVDGTGLKKLTGTKKNAYFPKWRPQPKK